MTRLSKAFVAALHKEIPVLFCSIGWCSLYDGTESPIGNHKGLPKDQAGLDAWEARAFLIDGGVYTCGVGEGLNVRNKRAHVVFVANEPTTQIKKVIGIYADAEFQIDEKYAFAKAKFASLIFPRPSLSALWPGRQGTRRWAIEHPNLSNYFVSLRRRLAGNRFLPQPISNDDIDYAAALVEGRLKIVLRKHRSREAKMRQQKIRSFRSANNGRLFCEVPGCNFDFASVYGSLGAGYAHVHHIRPLSKAESVGQVTELKDLIIVCANCHAMIHKNGGCRNHKTLIPERQGGRR